MTPIFYVFEKVGELGLLTKFFSSDQTQTSNKREGDFRQEIPKKLATSDK